MRLILDCDPEHIDAGIALLRQELAKFHRYDKIGWGWCHGNYRDGPRWFVRRIKDGLSAKQDRTIPSPDAPDPAP